MPFWTSQRAVMTYLSMLGLASFSLQRFNFSIAIICMVRTPRYHDNQTNASWNVDHNPSTVNLSTPLPKLHHPIPNPVPIASPDASASGVEDLCGVLRDFNSQTENGEFIWSKTFQGLLLSSILWGYVLLQLPGGRLSEQFGPRRVILVSQLPVFLLNILGPLLARTSPWLFMAARIVMGVLQGTMFPSVIDLLNRWSPPDEKSRMVGLGYTGSDVGVALMFPLGGFLCAKFGWASVFYTTGLLGVLWYILWFVFVADSPDTCNRISKAERLYLKQVIHHYELKHSPPVPWCMIFRSPAFLALLMSHPSALFCFNMMSTQVPTYMKEVLKFDITNNGINSMLPYATLVVISVLATWMADCLINRQIVPTIMVRKAMTSIGFFGMAICFVLITWMDCSQQDLAVALLCGGIGLSGALYAGFQVNHGEIAPQFAGTLFAITNLTATIPSVASPYIVALITQNQTLEEWRIAFFMVAAMCVFSGIVYLLMGQATVQPWAHLPPVTIVIEREEAAQEMIRI